MSRVVELLCSRRVPHVAALALMSFGFAGCSADMSTRLSQNSFSNPFASQPEATGSVPPARGRAPRTAAIFPPATAIPVAGPAAADRGAAVLSGRQWRRVRRRARARLLCAARRIRSRPPAPSRRARSRRPARPGQSGTTIIVGTSDTLDTPGAPLQCFARRDPAGQWLQGAARPVAGPATDHSASRPRAARRACAARSPRPRASRLPPPARRHRFMSSIAAIRCSASPIAITCRSPNSARANGLDPPAKLKLGTKLTVPGAKTAAVAPAAQPAAVAAAQPAAAAGAARHQNGRGAGRSASKARGWPRPPPRSKSPRPKAPVKAAEATGALPTFRWPVRGKVITSYGAKTNGKVE